MENSSFKWSSFQEAGQLNESGKWNPDAIEAELAHVGADEVRKAYHRATYWYERIEMCEWWANEIEKMRGNLSN